MEPILRLDHVSTTAYTRLAKIEDERFYDITEINKILQIRHLGVRKRAALAIARIGNRRGTALLMDMFVGEQDESMRATVAFALGVMADPAALPNLIASVTNDAETQTVRARSAEAIGKILGSPDNTDAIDKAVIERAIAALQRLLPDPAKTLNDEQKFAATMAINALYKSKADTAVPLLAAYLKIKDDDLRFQAANALARMRTAAAPAADSLLAGLSDSNPLVQISCARALAAIKEKRATEALLRLLNTLSAADASKQYTADDREMVQIEVVRALGQLGDKQAGAGITKVAEASFKKWRSESCFADCKAPAGESHSIMLLLEATQALGLLKEESALPLLKQIRFAESRRGSKLGSYPEFEIAVARFGEKEFFDIPATSVLRANDWQSMGNYAQGLGIVGGDRAHQELLDLLNGKKFNATPDPRVVEDILRALVRMKASDTEDVLRQNLQLSDPGVRAAAAGMLSNFANKANFELLNRAYERGKKDDLSEARLAALNGIAKFKDEKTVVESLFAAVTDSDYLVRAQAIKLLSKLSSESYDQYLGVIKKPHLPLFYDKVHDGFNTKTTATIVTQRGEIKILLDTRDAPMTVQNFVDLARRGFYNGVVFHRVVPNFVIQGGEPVNNATGSPGYQIRDEINMHPYTRGTVGMALAGRDTGGSQFFICHQPAPHLDGGYTVFGQVISGMEIVDQITRGDVIVKVIIKEE